MNNSFYLKSRVGWIALGIVSLPALADKKEHNQPDTSFQLSCSQPINRSFNFENKAIPKGKHIIGFDFSENISEQKTHLSGNVIFKNWQSTIKADDLIIDQLTKQLDATGNVSIESESSLFEVDSLSQDGESQQILLQNGAFSLFESGAQGSAEQIEVNVGEPTTLTNLTYSSCPKGEEDWQLSMTDLELNHQSGRGEAYNTVFRVADIPVFYLPYLSFPIDNRRQTGLLYPEITNDDKNGLDYTQPIYWNIAPWTDLTFYPRWIEKRGTQLGAEFRWLATKSLTQWQFEYLDNDKVVEEQVALTGDASIIEAAPKRWHSVFTHEAKFSQNWQLSINANRVSDSEYLRDFSSGLEASTQTYLESVAHLSYADPIWNIDLFAESDQSLIGQGIYRLMPSLRINGDKDTGSFRWQVNGEWTEFDHPDATAVIGSRRHIAPSVSYQIENSWGNITPKLSYWSTEYELENPIQNTNEKFSRNLAVFSLDAGMTFEKALSWNNQQYVHLLSPRLFYAHIPYEQQNNIQLFDTQLPLLSFRQLWQENRFSGIDRVGDTNHLSIAIENQFINNKTAKSSLRFDLGRKVYFDDRQIGLNAEQLETNGSSAWIAGLDWQVSDSLSVKNFVEWQSSNSTTNQAYTTIKFEPQANHIVNLTHRYRDQGVNQVQESDFSFAWPINAEWRLVGRWYNDDSRKQIIESLAGIEYESCCWAMRIVAQKYLNTQLDSNGFPITNISDEYTSGIHVQFVFKGLGSAGKSGLGNVLESGINGYRDSLEN